MIKEGQDKPKESILFSYSFLNDFFNSWIRHDNVCFHSNVEQL